MSNDLFLNTGRFVFFILLQVLILNHINFLGYINPYLYVMFILILPVSMPQWQVIFMGFLIGFSVDAFGDTGGVHAAASTLIAYLRPFLLRKSYGLSYDYQTIKFNKTPLKEKFLFVTAMVLIHHTALFLLVFFNFSHILLILKATLFSSLFTILLIFIVTSLIPNIKR